MRFWKISGEHISPSNQVVIFSILRVDISKNVVSWICVHGASVFLKSTEWNICRSHLRQFRTARINRFWSKDEIIKTHSQNGTDQEPQNSETELPSAVCFRDRLACICCLG